MVGYLEFYIGTSQMLATCGKLLITPFVVGNTNASLLGCVAQVNAMSLIFVSPVNIPGMSAHAREPAEGQACWPIV